LAELLVAEFDSLSGKTLHPKSRELFNLIGSFDTSQKIMAGNLNQRLWRYVIVVLYLAEFVPEEKRSGYVIRLWLQILLIVVDLLREAGYLPQKLEKAFDIVKREYGK
jgi:hypothetical protein